jgi:hypothetical protein
MIPQQKILAPKEVKYSYGPYNVIKGDTQRIRITEGCPWDHPFCYEPTEINIFGIPKIERNKVEISDMNLLYKPEALDIIKELGTKRVNGKVVYYDLMCGIDFRFLTQNIANALKENRFKKIRIVWDFSIKEQYKIKDAVDILRKAGYTAPNDIMVFMICNWLTPHKENLQKLDLCKVWRVQVSDCYFDDQVMPKVNPIHWTWEQIKDFRSRVRPHNQIVTFGIYPEIKAPPKSEINGDSAGRK